MRWRPRCARPSVCRSRRRSRDVVSAESLESFRAELERLHADAAAALLAQGESARNAALDPVEHAAWTQVAALILNLSEVITRN